MGVAAMFAAEYQKQQPVSFVDIKQMN